MRRNALLAATMLVALVALGLGNAGCGSEDAAPEAERSTGAEEMTGAATDMDETGTSVGQYPPDFALADLDENIMTLADFEDKVVIIDLWATWCPPCREEIPFLVDLYEEHRDAGLVVVGIGLDQGGAAALRPFIEENNVSYPILVGDRAVSRAYGASSIPTTYIIGRDGRIVARHVGFHPTLAGEIRSTVEQLLDGVEA